MANLASEAAAGVRRGLPVASPSRRVSYAILAAGVLACVVAVVYGDVIRRTAYGWFIDTWTYSNAVERWLHGSGIYAPLQLRGPYFLPNAVLVGYAYPPPSVVLLAPFASFPVGWFAWIVVNMGVLLSGLWALVHKSWPDRAPAYFGVILLFLSVFRPFMEAFEGGNVNGALAGLLAWAAALGRTRTVAVAGAVAALFKVSPAAFILWAGGRDRRNWVIGAAAAGLLVLVTLPLVGISSWGDYLTAMVGARASCRSDIPSLMCLLASWGTAGKVACLAAAVFCAVLSARVERRIFSIGLLALSMMLPVADLHSHYWLLLLVVLIVGLADVTGVQASGDEPTSTESTGRSE